jgi:methionyl-tRNA formyltransferase
MGEMSNLAGLAQSRVWNSDLVENVRRSTGFEIVEIRDSSELKYSLLESLNPDYVFFPHWSTLIDKEIYQNFECIIFHMTDLPFGRGGSPLQNLIARGFSETKISAIKCVKDLDAGPIYLKRQMNLDGSAQEIYFRAAGIIEEMIVEIVRSRPKPIDQIGDPVVFKRRVPSESKISDIQSTEELYDFIRMLDADGYPHAFVDCGEFRIEFRNAKFSKTGVSADASIIRIDHSLE